LGRGFGGTIIDTINNEDGSTTLIVLNLPLDDGERPQRWEYS
jgi:starvation-inducible outer membrane lipoprotein